MSLIHPTAIVSPQAELGSDVEVGPYSIIGPNVQLGDRCKIHPHVVVDGHTTLGSDNEVFPFASLGAAPQDLKFKGEPSTLIVGTGNKIRECVTLHPGTAKGTMSTVIGNNNLFMANCHVAHDCRVGSNNVFANSAALAGHVTVQDSVILGGLVGIHQFCRVGSFVILSAGAMVPYDVPPYCMGQGDRCYLRGINVIGLERAGMTKEEVAEIRRVYRLLFSTVGKLKEKIAAIPSELAAKPRVKYMLDFIGASERGVMSPAKKLRTDS